MSKITHITGRAVPVEGNDIDTDRIIPARYLKEITFTNNPDASSLTSDASQAVSLGLLKPVNLTGIFDLTPLNQALSAAGESQVSS